MTKLYTNTKQDPAPFDKMFGVVKAIESNAEKLSITIMYHKGITQKHHASKLPSLLSKLSKKGAIDQDVIEALRDDFKTVMQFEEGAYTYTGPKEVILQDKQVDYRQAICEQQLLRMQEILMTELFGKSILGESHELASSDMLVWPSGDVDIQNVL